METRNCQHEVRSKRGLSLSRNGPPLPMVSKWLWSTSQPPLPYATSDSCADKSLLRLPAAPLQGLQALRFPSVSLLLSVSVPCCFPADHSHLCKSRNTHFSMVSCVGLPLTCLPNLTPRKSRSELVWELFLYIGRMQSVASHVSALLNFSLAVAAKCGKLRCLPRSWEWRLSP